MSKLYYERPPLPVVLVFCFFVVIVVLSVMNYIDVASNCDGIVVKDYMNMPVCIPTNGTNVSIPIR